VIPKDGVPAVPLPCPFCGSDQLVEVETLDSSKLIYVGCADCGARGPVQHSTALANEEWNERAEAVLPNPPDERAAFEKWGNDYFNYGFKPETWLPLENEYTHEGTQMAWDGWQARAALPSSPPREPAGWKEAVQELVRAQDELAMAESADRFGVPSAPEVCYARLSAAWANARAMLAVSPQGAPDSSESLGNETERSGQAVQRPLQSPNAKEH
jgi:Lar family restriction alleviation protein